MILRGWSAVELIMFLIALVLSICAALNKM